MHRAEHESFRHNCQMAPMCTPWFTRSTWVCSFAKQHLERLTHFNMAHLCTHSPRYCKTCIGMAHI